MNQISQRIRQSASGWLDHQLARRGLRLTKTGRGYLNAEATIRAAERAGLSICDYLESGETDPRKRGRRDRIIAELQTVGCFQRTQQVIEIGTGTGMYLDRVLELAAPASYEIYETAIDWKRYLGDRGHGSSTQITVHDADGISLRQSADASADLVHAHGVFVYLTTIETAGYLTEMARVCRPGGYVVFDCYLDTSFDADTIQRWVKSGWSFPVISCRRLLAELYDLLGLTVVHRFQEIHGASAVDYEVLRKV
jgi:ubiquinone/menaquinone biosynthesis C-methylase UbiE